MTMCNVFLTEDVAVMLTDTLEYLEGGKPFRLGLEKARLARNGRFAIGGQGLSAIADEAREVLEHCADVDEAAALGAELLTGVWSAELRPGDVQRILIAGRDAANRVRGVMIARREGRGTTEVTHLPMGATLLPSPGPSARLPSEWPDERLVKLAYWQSAMAPRFGLPIAVGGVIHKTTISAHGADQRVLTVSPDYDDLCRALGGDPLAASVERVRRVRADVE